VLTPGTDEGRPSVVARCRGMIIVRRSGACSYGSKLVGRHTRARSLRSIGSTFPQYILHVSKASPCSSACHGLRGYLLGGIQRSAACLCMHDAELASSRGARGGDIEVVRCGDSVSSLTAFSSSSGSRRLAGRCAASMCCCVLSELTARPGGARAPPPCSVSTRGRSGARSWPGEQAAARRARPMHSY
jgi:hypothetical protein